VSTTHRHNRTTVATTEATVATGKDLKPHHSGHGTVQRLPQKKLFLFFHNPYFEHAMQAVFYQENILPIA